MSLLFFLFLTLSRGAPLSLTPSSATFNVDDCAAFLAFRDTASQDSNGRTIWDIVWSCLATIFACTWSAFHPNIPGPYDSGWSNLKRRVVATFYALIAPEIVTLWALKQYFGARAIVRDYNETVTKSKVKKQGMLESVKKWFSSIPPKPIGGSEPWTMTHGFFVQMGGFLLCEDDKPVQVLDYARLKRCISNGTIYPPDISKEEIQDRSKGDFISKGLVVLQTSWFVLQCITRWSQKLPLSELEVLTLGFAALNGITYALWWNKPQDVGKAFRIATKKSFPNPNEKPSVTVSTELPIDPKPVSGPERPESVPQAEPTDLNFKPVPLVPETATSKKESDTMLALPVLANNPSSLAENETNPESDKGLPESSMIAIDNLVTVPPPPLTREKVNFLQNWMKDDYEQVDGSWSSLIWFYAFRIPLHLVQWSLNVIAKMIAADSRLMDGAVRMPMFATEALATESYGDVMLASCGIGALFGAVHLVAWASPFPTQVERLLWRSSALYIAAFPVSIVVGMIICGAIADAVVHFFKIETPEPLVDVGSLIVWIGATLYGFARAILIFEAMFSLRSLSPAVYQDVEWTMFIPHL